jgi:hypothetical protein
MWQFVGRGARTSGVRREIRPHKSAEPLIEVLTICRISQKIMQSTERHNICESVGIIERGLFCCFFHSVLTPEGI